MFWECAERVAKALDTKLSKEGTDKASFLSVKGRELLSPAVRAEIVSVSMSTELWLGNNEKLLELTSLSPFLL